MKLIIIPFLVWLIAYLIKRFVDFATKEKRYLHYGGWPSTHAAITASLTTVMALEFGVQSAAFAISLVLTVVILTDAIALRPLISKQSKALNKFHHQHLPDHVGHTSVEVISGAVIAFILTVILYQVF